MRDSKEPYNLDGMKYLASAPEGEIIKDMISHKGKLFVSTDKHIYTLEDEKRLELINIELLS